MFIENVNIYLSLMYEVIYVNYKQVHFASTMVVHISGEMTFLDSRRGYPYILKCGPIAPTAVLR